MKVIVLCSGGLDSLVTSELYLNLGYEVKLLYIDYQNKNADIEYNKLCKYYNRKKDSGANIELASETINLGFLKPFTSSSENDYVPMRNLIFSAIALSLADAESVEKVALGFIHIENGYMDADEQFIKGLNTLLAGTPMIVEAPLINASKLKVAKLANQFGFKVADFYTCEFPKSNGDACGVCDKCRDFKAVEEIIQPRACITSAENI